MMQKSMTEIQQEIADEFSLFEDRMAKYEYIIEIGKELPDLKEELKVENALVKGCQSRVWLHAHGDSSKINFKADSDAFIVRGLVTIALKVFSGRSADEILNGEITFVKDIGLNEILSPTRANGLASLLKQMKLYALAYKAKAEV